jgi:hypothetical protein
MITPLLLILAVATATQPQAMERVRVSADSRGFILAQSGRPFHPWGLNYGNAGRLIEDYWETDWPTIERDFREMNAAGANVARVHLQLGKFMSAPDRPNDRALERLGRLLDLAERTHVYLDLTGLACYRKADVPDGYDGLSERERWAVQSRFWEAVATRCAENPAVFCYDLINEPLVPGERRQAGAWYSGKAFGGYDFLQFISLDPAGRPREQVVHDWIGTLTAAIRKHDRRTMITVGQLPSTPAWGHFSGFVPAKVAPDVDFISVHIYPEKDKVDEAIKTLRGFVTNKPLVIEETFNLSCPTADEEAFLRKSKEFACGWMGHYDGKPAKELGALRDSKQITIGQSMMLEWLELFEKLKPELAGATP